MKYECLTSARCDRATEGVELYDCHLIYKELYLSADNDCPWSQGLHRDYAGVMKRHDGNRCMAVICSVDSLHS